ncbi:MAG: hypothetical protein H6977_08940 [Gammaproteobacteria bacterium]|nr:hypothetical protein [Gammaproteobacteria bacterium]
MNPEERTQPNPNDPTRTGAPARRTTTVVALVSGTVIGLLAAGGITWAALYDGVEDKGPGDATADAAAAPPSAPAPAASPPAASTPPQPPRENCAVYLADARRDNGRVLKNGAVGAMVGAGTGAAGGAIADGGDGAGKGAGIGAVVGAVAGTLHGLTGEKERVSAAERAYRDCLARND